MNKSLAAAVKIMADYGIDNILKSCKYTKTLMLIQSLVIYFVTQILFLCKLKVHTALGAKRR